MDSNETRSGFSAVPLDRLVRALFTTEKDMEKEEIWQMAHESGLCDEDLSSEDQLMTDYGDSTASVFAFAEMVESKTRRECADLCIHLSLDGLSGHEYASEILKRSNA